MATAVQDEALVHRYGRPVALDAEPTALIWLGDIAAVALRDGSVRLIVGEYDARAVDVHAGAILSACAHPDGKGIVTGGDDGRVCHVAVDGGIAELGRFERKWVEHLVASPASGLIVAARSRGDCLAKRGCRAVAPIYGRLDTVCRTRRKARDVPAGRHTSMGRISADGLASDA